ncbi:MAG: hypothetical protein AAF657_13995 [Acidobacteriota bacterium]
MELHPDIRAELRRVADGAEPSSTPAGDACRLIAAIKARVTLSPADLADELRQLADEDE